MKKIIEKEKEEQMELSDEIYQLTKRLKKNNKLLLQELENDKKSFERIESITETNKSHLLKVEKEVTLLNKITSTKIYTLFIFVLLIFGLTFLSSTIIKLF